MVAVYSDYHGSRYESTIAYLHYDALGSVDAITSAQGDVVQRSAYKPFGERIALMEAPGARLITNRGYTGHEEISGTDLIHANARIYDPTLGRFMSADTLIQDPHDIQSYDRYAYVRNNPMRYTDPSGHSWMDSVAGAIFGAIFALGGMGIGMGVAAMLGLSGYAAVAVTGMFAGFMGGIVGGAMKGNSLGDIILGGFKGAFWGGVSAVASYAIAESISAAFPGINGHAISFFTATRAIGYRAALIKSLLHGVVRGAINVLQNGGKFISSFASAFITSAFALGRNVLGQGAIIARTAISAVVGGAASVITGGKFLSGAVSAAFVHMFNAESGGGFWKNFKKGAKDLWEGIKSYPRALMAYGDYLARATGFRDWQEGNFIHWNKLEANIQYKVFMYAIRNAKIRNKITTSLKTDIINRPMYYIGGLLTPTAAHSLVGIGIKLNIGLGMVYAPIKIEGAVIDKVNNYTVDLYR